MGEIIEFRSRAELAEESADIDLLTAVDVAIRDLRDIAARWGEGSSDRARHVRAPPGCQSRLRCFRLARGCRGGSGLVKGCLNVGPELAPRRLLGLGQLRQGLRLPHASEVVIPLPVN